MTDVVGDERRAPLPRRVRRTVALGTVALVLALVCGDLALRSRETSVLQRCVRGSESDLADVARRAAALETYVGPALRAAATSPRLRSSLASVVEGSIGERLPALRRDQQLCRSTWVVHPSARRARHDYLAWLGLRLRQLTASATELDALHTDVPGLTAARDLAVRSMAAVRVSP